MVLNHFCLSGGMSHFLRKRQWREYVGTDTWPIYLMVTCDDFEVSVGGFWEAWSLLQQNYYTQRVSERARAREREKGKDPSL